MNVIATAPGFDNIRVRQVGEEFEMPEGTKGSWFKPVGGDDKPTKPAKPAKPAKTVPAQVPVDHKTVGDLAADQSQLA